MISANALDHASNEAAEHLTATEEGRRIARDLAEALSDYAERAERQAREKLELAKAAHLLARAARDQAANAYDAATDRNHNAKE